MKEKVIQLGCEAIFKLVLSILLLWAMLFLPSRHWGFREGWLYLLILGTGSSLICLDLFLRDPNLLRRRIGGREEQTTQRNLIRAAWPLCIGVFVLAGIDERMEWGEVFLPLKIVAFILLCISYLLLFLVLRSNRYASRTIEVAKGQVVISHGLYAHVRHPLYSAALLLYGATPLALDCYWGLSLFFPLLAVIVLRILAEERFLQGSLDGYSDYMKRVSYRLVPGIW